MTNYNRETSVPTDEELLLWGWTTNHISHLRTLPPSSQNAVLQEYIKRIMEDGDSDNLDF